LGEKRPKQHNSLQIAGFQLGSNRKVNIPSKYDKSPYVRQVEHGAKPQNQRSVALSMAARKKEMQF